MTASRPRLLDLFSGAGGAGMGYHRAGFDVVGVDIKPMSRYPFEFHQADALEYLAEHGHEFDAIHASPPCQAYTPLQALHKHVERAYQATALRLAQGDVTLARALIEAAREDRTDRKVDRR